MRYHTIVSSLWQDDRIRKITPRQKLTYIYLFSNEKCTLSGIYKIAPEMIAFETQITEEEATSDLEALNQIMLISYDFKKNVVWVRGKIKHHKNTWKTYESAKSVSNDLAEFHDCCFSLDIPIKYPETLDMAIMLEDLRKRRYKPKEAKDPKEDVTVSESVSESVSVPTRGACGGHVGSTQ